MRCLDLLFSISNIFISSLRFSAFDCIGRTSLSRSLYLGKDYGIAAAFTWCRYLYCFCLLQFHQELAKGSLYFFCHSIWGINIWSGARYRSLVVTKRKRIRHRFKCLLSGLRTTPVSNVGFRMLHVVLQYVRIDKLSNISLRPCITKNCLNYC